MTSAREVRSVIREETLRYLHYSDQVITKEQDDLIN